MIHQMSRSFIIICLSISMAFVGVSAQAAGGALDFTFSMDGKVTTDFGGRGDFGYAAALQPDGKIVVAGGSTDYSPCCTHEIALARYTSNGLLDASFHGDGKVITSVRDASLAEAIVVQPDGKIVVAGSSTLFNGQNDFTLLRYNSNGSLDTTFDSDGQVTTDFGSHTSAVALALQPDGKIIAAGFLNNANGSLFALARYNSNGSLDTTFDIDGKVTTDFGTPIAQIQAIELQADGKIVVAGYSRSGAIIDFALARYNSNGSLDLSFDTDGKVTTDFGFNDSAFDVAIQADGKIVAAGSGDTGDNFDFALARYNSNGSLDSTFEMDGRISPVLGSNIYNGAFAVAIQTDRKIVVAGRSGGNADFVLVRYHPNGLPDGSFGTQGIVKTAIGNGEDYGEAILLAPDSKIIVAGSSSNAGTYDFALARYISDMYMLTLTKTGDGTGSVISNPVGIQCGATCNYEFNVNAVVTLTASSTAGSTFVGWYGGGCAGTGACIVGMTQAMSISACFKSTPTSGTGPDTTGVFRPGNGALFLKNNNCTGVADMQINYGIGGDYPIVGDWDGNGTSTIGIYRNGSFYLRNSNTVGFADVVFPFGMMGDQPVAGDWNGDSLDTIGVYRRGTFFLRNSNTLGSPEMVFGLGIPGDVGITGDWNGDGLDTTGVFRPANGALYLKNQNTTGFADIQINYGIGGDKPIVGDWNDDGMDTIGIYRDGVFYLRNSNTIGFADLVFALGISGDHPIAGNWDGLP